MVGGISALLQQKLHPLALAGAWDHSTFCHDMLGRLHRTRRPPHAASDHEMLIWVHSLEVSQFLVGYLRYVDPQLPVAEQDRYYREVALIAERLGAQ